MICSTVRKVIPRQRAPTQRIREILPVAHDVAELRYLLSEAFDWGSVQARLTEIRHHYCDAFMDGKAGERAAIVIVEALG